MITEFFLKNLSDLLEREKLSQLGLSKASGIPQGMINKWFNRKTVPSMIALEKLAAFFNVEPYYFFMKPGTQKTHSEIEKPQDEVDEFKKLIDECAERVLSELDMKQYRSLGGHNVFVKRLRMHYDGEGIDISDWYMLLLDEFNKYTTVDLRQKLNEILNKKNPDRQKAIDARKALEAKKNETA